MMEYTINEHLSVAFGAPEAKLPSNDQTSKAFTRPLGNKEQNFGSNNSFTESVDNRVKKLMNVQGAFQSLEQLMHHRQESKQLCGEIVKIFTEMLQIDGACIYKYTTETTFEVLACNAVWSNIYSALQGMEEGNGQGVLLNPIALLPHNTGAVPFSLGKRNYGYIVSLPLVSEGTTFGAIALFSAHSHFFTPERLEIFRMIASLAASIYMNIHVKGILEQSQIERVTLQKDIQMLQGQVASFHHNLGVDADAESAYNELEALSYSISHDLRAPIRAIRNNCEWLNTQYSSDLDTNGHTLLQQINESSEHLEKLLDGLLSFSKVVQLKPQQSLIDMAALARSVIDELLNYENGSSALSISVQPLLPAYGDETLIRQVWYNLLSNAFKYTRYKQKREITIDSHQFNGGVRYCIGDNGIGFDMQYVGRLFGAFHRLHVAEEFEGTGVGLAIVQRIIRRHGGQIWAEGKVDNGAQFYFILPSKKIKSNTEETGTVQ